MEKKLRLIQQLLLLSLIIIVCQCAYTCEQQCHSDRDFSQQCIDECQAKKRKSAKLVGIIVGSIFGPPILFLIGLLFYALINLFCWKCHLNCNKAFRKMKQLHKPKKVKNNNEQSLLFSKHLDFLDKHLSNPGQIIIEKQFEKVGENKIKERQLNYEEQNLWSIEIKGSDEWGQFDAEGCFVGKSEGNMFWFVKHYFDKDVSKQIGDIIFESDILESEIPEIGGRWQQFDKNNGKNRFGTWFLKVDDELSGPHRKMRLLHNHPKDDKNESPQFSNIKHFFENSNHLLINEDYGLKYPMNVNKIHQFTPSYTHNCLSVVKFRGRDFFGEFHAQGYLVDKFEGTMLWFIKKYRDQDVRIRRKDVIFESEFIEGVEIKGRWHEDGMKDQDGYSGTWNLAQQFF